MGCTRSGQDGEPVGRTGQFLMPGSLVTALTDTDPAPGDGFGASVTTFGRSFVLSATADDAAGIGDAGTAWLLDGDTGTLSAIANPEPSQGDRFGAAGCVSDRALAIVVPDDDPAGIADAGSVYLVGTAGALIAAIPNPSPEPGDLFGRSCAATSDRFLVVASKDDPGGVIDAGSAYLFGPDGALIADIPNPAALSDLFGTPRPVAVAGNFVIAAPSADFGGFTNAGTVYLVEGSSGQLVTIENPDPATNDFFGYRIATAGTNFVVAAPFDSSGDGSVYLYAGSDGTLITRIANPDLDGLAPDNFGVSLYALGVDFAVSVIREEVGGLPYAGVLYLFDGADGSLKAAIPHPDPGANDNFGGGALRVGNRLVVSAVADTIDGHDYAGSVFLFDGVDYTLLAAIPNPEPQAYEWFGDVLVAVPEANAFLVGVRRDQPAGDGAEAGTIYVYDAATGALIDSIANPGSTSSEWFGARLAAAGRHFVAGLPSDDPQGVTDAGTAWLYRVNRPPDVSPLDLSVLEDATVDFALEAVDGDGDPLSLTVTAAPLHGSLTGSLPSLSYSPVPNYNGPDSFTVTATDVFGASSEEIVTIGVMPVNDPPVAGNMSVTIAEDASPFFSPPIVPPVTDPDCADAGSFCLLITEVLLAPSNGDVSGGQAFYYTPSPNFFGNDSFTYRATLDGASWSAPATVSIIVTPVNDAPIVAGESFTTLEDEPLVLDAPGVLANDYDIEGDDLFAVGTCPPPTGICVVSSSDPQDSLVLSADGSFVYTPPPDWSGTRIFHYKVNDDGGASSAVVPISITIEPVNDAPVAGGDSYAGSEDELLLVPAESGVLRNDVDVDSAFRIAELVTGAAGSVALSTDGSFSYAPPAEFSGVDSFQYRVIDESGLSSTATVSISITAIDDPPVAAAETFAAIEDLPFVRAAPGVLSNDSDVDSQLLKALLRESPQHGQLALATDGSFTFLPATNFHGIDSFAYAVTDGTSESLATAILDVGSVNDPPTIPVPLSPTAGEARTGGSVELAWLGSSDVDGDDVFYRVVVERDGSVVADRTAHYGQLSILVPLDAGEYTWRVGAIDASGLGSVESPPEAFSMLPSTADSGWRCSVTATTPTRPGVAWALLLTLAVMAARRAHGRISETPE